MLPVGAIVGEELATTVGVEVAPAPEAIIV